MNRIGAAFGTCKKLRKLWLRIVLVQGGERPVLAQRTRHRHGSRHVHVGGDQRKALPFRAGVQEAEGAVDIDGAAGVEGRPLGANEDVLEIELDVGFDAHDVSGDVEKSRSYPTI